MVRLRLDPEVVEYFKTRDPQREGVNAVLRAYVEYQKSGKGSGGSSGGGSGGSSGGG
ncbi:MAG: hypothetical protein R3C52_11235 [Hyphomonadaceae bacterium]